MGRPSGARLNELPKRTAQGAGVWLCLCGAWVRSVAAISGPLPGASRVRGWGVVGARSRHSAGDKRVTGGDGGRGRCLSARQEPERPSSTRTHVRSYQPVRSRGRVVLVFRSSYAGTAGTRYRLRPLNTGPTTTPPRGSDRTRRTVTRTGPQSTDATSIRPPSGSLPGTWKFRFPRAGRTGSADRT